MSEKIINVNGPEGTPQLLSATQPLSNEVVGKLVTAVNRLRYLRGQKLATAERDAEIRGAQAFIANTLLKHADEFIGGQWALMQEYDPLLNLITNVAIRVQDIIARRTAQLEATRKQIQETPVENE